jgi:hypothetical protein
MFALESELTSEGRQLLMRYIAKLPRVIWPVVGDEVFTEDDGHLVLPNLHTVDWQRRSVRVKIYFVERKGPG